jgi:hypothetical protein
MGRESFVRRLGTVLALTLVGLTALCVLRASATSQWSKRTGMDCVDCHSVFPRLNATGAKFLEDGYVLLSAHGAEAKEGESKAEAAEEGGLYLPNVNHLLGFRLNMTPLMLETNSLAVDSLGDRRSQFTIGNPVWVQFFVAGPIQKNISFFSELEYAQSAFKFNWFYFNFTRLAGTPGLNFQVGNISPLEFASMPNRLPQLPAIKGEAFLIKSANGKGDDALDMSSARPGVQYFGHVPALLVYAGVSPGKAARDNNQFVHGWGGLVLRAPEGTLGSLEGSNATIHYYTGTDTKGTGSAAGQRTDAFWRLSPQVNLRWTDKLDVQAAYVLAHDDNWGLVANPTEGFDFQGVAVEAGYMPRPEWHLGLHYDQYQSDNEVAGKPVLDFQRIVPALTYVFNQNFRATVYLEHDLLDRPAGTKVERVYLNLRTMF